MYTPFIKMYTLYFIEISDEIKCIIVRSNVSVEEITEKHCEVYSDDFSILEEVVISSSTKKFITTDILNNNNFLNIHNYNKLLGEEKKNIKSFIDEIVKLNNNLTELDCFKNIFYDDKCETSKQPSINNGYSLGRDISIFTCKTDKPLVSPLVPDNKPPSDIKVVGFSVDNNNNNNNLEYSYIGTNDTDTTDCYSIIGTYENETKSKKSFVYYNKHFEIYHILEDEISECVFPEITFVDNILTKDKDKLNLFLDKNNDIITFEEIKNIVDVVNNIKVKDNKTNNVIENVKIKIKDLYDLSNTKDNKIKSSILLQNILKLCGITNKEDISLIRRNISSILISLGLEKKRYKNGNYWFGITLKERKCYDKTKNVLEKDMENYFKEINTRYVELNDINITKNIKNAELEKKISTIPEVDDV
jgi:hypothetical protein